MVGVHAVVLRGRRHEQRGVGDGGVLVLVTTTIIIIIIIIMMIISSIINMSVYYCVLIFVPLFIKCTNNTL